MAPLIRSCKSIRPNLAFLCVDRSNSSSAKKPSGGDKKEKTADDKEDKPGKIKYPEEPTTCCMSGCANCVWLDYAEKLSEYYKDGGEQALKEINEKVTDQNIKAFLLHELRMRK